MSNSIAMEQQKGFYFLSDAYSRKVIRIVTLFIYFLLFQSLILFQKPFLQFDFVVVFYISFGVLFTHQLTALLSGRFESATKAGLFSYLADFIILMFFMKHFPYLSSFILVLQLFLLFIASFDLDLFSLSILGFISSMGVSLINLSATGTGAMQNILSLTLFNLSYVSVIVISSQLKTEFVQLQSDLNVTTKKWKTQEELAKTVIENIPLGLAVFQKDEQLVLQNSYLQEHIKISSIQLNSILSDFRRKSSAEKQLTSDYVYKATDNDDKKIFNIDEATYFDVEINESLNMYLVKDVTEIRELEYQSKQNEKLAAIGQLAAGIAHEIRNPLAGISGSIQLLSQDTVDETQKKLMNIILKEIDRLNSLITEFLDYAKPTKSPDMVVNLKQIVDEIYVMTKGHPDLPPGFKWNFDLRDVNILGHHEKLKQALLNIVINSIQAMKDKPDASLSISLVQEALFTVIKIKDNGCGMNEDTKKKMFEPFHTTKAKGTGLGLAITHKILENHRSTVVVNSQVNAGTEFIIKFPIIKG